jgi:DAK2 domain fusion protein YloV
MILSAAANLANHKEEVDNMNVFPVPDGDTGTNMSMTMDACEAAIVASDSDSVAELSKIVANAALRGARGNSGVILSQLMRGIHKAVSNCDTMNCKAISMAFQSAAKSAYKAVMKPTEGTILTVAREMAEFAQKNEGKYEDIVKFFTAIVESGKVALSKTPEMLPQLKQAGVVDSGGQGLVYICEGMLFVLVNEAEVNRENASMVKSMHGAASVDIKDLKYQYCTECIIEKSSKNADAFKLKLTLEPKGDSMVVVDDEEIIKIHIHTNKPDFVLGEALKYGELSSVKIENMKLQHNNLIDGKSNASKEESPKNNTPEKEFGFVCVAAGEGLSDTFKKLGVDCIIEGGQTMNPSTDDILGAIENINAKNIFVYPNNKNIIMAAQQAKELSDKNIYVIPTKSIMQAMSSILVFDEDLSADDNYNEMLSAISYVKSAQITYAVRDTVVNDIKITPGDILGILEGKISSVEGSVDVSVFSLLNKMVDDDSSVITLFYGNDTTKEDADNLKQQIEDKYPDCDVYMHFGGQPVYYYFLSVE